MLASLDQVVLEGDRPASVLHGLVDDNHVAAIGHSAGGGTAFDALSDPRVDVAVGWAPTPGSGTPAAKPTMIIGGADDIGVTSAQLAQTYASLPPPKRRVEISGAGHNSFTDLCVVNSTGGGMVNYAIENGLVPAGAAQVLLNGCEETAASSHEVWPVVQHFTVAELRAAFGIDAEPVGLESGVARAFGEIDLTYEQQP
jgi:dienelactone hydrolase